MITKIKKRKSNGSIPYEASICSELFDVDYFNFSPVNGHASPNSPFWAGKVPHANVRENEDSFIIELAIPGVQKKDVAIDIQGKTLNVSVDREDDLAKNERYTKREFDYSSFERSFILPDWIDTQGIEAVYQNGLIRILLDKMPENKKVSTKRIELVEVS